MFCSRDHVRSLSICVGGPPGVFSRNQSARVHFLDSTPCGEYCKFCHYSILYLGLNGNGYTYNPSRVNIIQSPLLSPFVFLVNSILGIFWTGRMFDLSQRIKLASKYVPRKNPKVTISCRSGQ